MRNRSTVTSAVTVVVSAAAVVGAAASFGAGLDGCSSSNSTAAPPSGGDAAVDVAAQDSGALPIDASGPPPEVLAAAKEWPLANRDYAGTRATSDSRISSSTIATLKQAWSYPLPGLGSFGAATSPAIVLNGTVYYVDMQSNVFALDAVSGAERWKKTYGASTLGPNGVAVGWGKVFVPSSETTFAALAADTGAELWTAPIVVPKNGGIALPPIAYDGKVYVSTSPVNADSEYLGGVNGTLYALDQATGSIAWSFATVQDATLWGNADVNSGGGAWCAPTIDVQRDTMYWGIGNPGPYPGTDAAPNGASRPGDNLYTSSVVALSHSTGALTWYHQERPHDLFDLDFQNPPIPVTVSIGGVDRHLVIGSGKTGTVAALDADAAGALVWRATVGKHQNDDITAVPEGGLEVFPGNLGGVETPLAYSNGTVFVPIVDWGRNYTATGIGSLDPTSTGELIALDATTGAVRWQVSLDAPAFGSVTVVNDLVLVSTFNAVTYAGTVYAFDTTVGKQVWSYAAPLGINAPLTVSGDTLLIPAGAGVGTPSLIALTLP